MGRVLGMPLEGGGTVMIELDDDDEGTMVELPGGIDRAVEERTLSDALSEVSPAIDEVVHQMRSTASRPDRFTVQFGIKITEEAGAVIAREAEDANFIVTAEWDRPLEYAESA